MSTGSKLDQLMAALIEDDFDEGSVSDRLYLRESGLYEEALLGDPEDEEDDEAGDPTQPLSLNDYMVANSTDLNIIQ